MGQNKETKSNDTVSNQGGPRRVITIITDTMHGIETKKKKP